MTGKEFLAKHYGSLSAGIFGLGLLGILAVFGGNFGAYMTQPAGEIAPAPAGQPAQPQQNESPPANTDESAPQDKTAETEEDEKDPLEQAIEAEAAKAQERREAIREEINKEREEAGLPLLPAEDAEVNGE